jgi:wyosine [tRNA(Phe)-imidazoG37] synthetase (radical SAM superfamily)
MKLQTIFGPVPSRRLGFSLGIDPVPFKVCSMDCIYCQLGRTTLRTVERHPHISLEMMLDEWECIRQGIGDIDCIALAGSGEPTLNSDLGKIIEKLRDRTGFPIAVLTNGSLLFRRDVRKDLLKAHIVLPSLDAVTPAVFEKVNRPHPSLAVEEIVDGLKAFRSSYKGQMWLEVMLVKGVNDSQSDLERLRESIQDIAPDKVQLNTVVRPSDKGEAKPVGAAELKKAQRFLGGRCEIIADVNRKKRAPTDHNLEGTILSMVRRHPLTITEIIDAVGRKRGEVLSCINRLHDGDMIEVSCHRGKRYCKAREGALVSQRP